MHGRERGHDDACDREGGHRSRKSHSHSHASGHHSHERSHRDRDARSPSRGADHERMRSQDPVEGAHRSRDVKEPPRDYARKKEDEQYRKRTRTPGRISGDGGEGSYGPSPTRIVGPQPPRSRSTKDDTSGDSMNYIVAGPARPRTGLPLTVSGDPEQDLMYLRHDKRKADDLDSFEEEFLLKSSRKTKKSKVVHEKWMTELPELRRAPDPLNLKSQTTFRKTPAPSDTERSVWTSIDGEIDPSSEKKRVVDQSVLRKEERIAEELEAFKYSQRPRSLMEEHKERMREGKLSFQRDEVQKIPKPWDRSAKQVTLNPKRAHDVISSATKLGSRFTPGSAGSRFL